MAFPITNYSRVWVRGKLVDLAKAAREVTNYGASGPIQFIPTPTALVDSATKQYIYPTPFSVFPAATDGAFSLQLPATNDPDINPTGWNYKVILPWGDSFYMSVPYNTANLNSVGDPLHGSPVIELSSVVPDPSGNPGMAQIVTGADGRSITGATINGSSHMILTMSDSSTIDAGAVVAGIDAEGVRDTMGTALVPGTGIGIAVNDGADTITVSTTALLPTLATAKGDLLVATASGTVTRLPVGSNGQAVVADSTQTTGLKYATVASPYVTHTPSDHGIIEWNFDPDMASSNTSALTSGTVYLAKITAQTGGTVNNVWINVTTAGSGLTSGQCFGGLYNSAGSRIGVTADQSGVWNTADIYPMTLAASATVTAGSVYYVAVLAVGTTGPTLARGPSSSKGSNAGLTGAGLRFSVNGTTQTSLPSTRTLSSNTATNALNFWCALS